jgi:cyclopropane-fatty-acyl-phospholipid synthase
MFEHMRNWRELFARIAHWLKPGGQFFLHTFSHRTTPYPYEDRGEGDWMTRHFFTGGMMPSHDLATRFSKQNGGGVMQHQAVWWLNGLHYARTAEAWLRNFDAHAAPIHGLFREVYGADSKRWFVRWRIFFMACAGTFGANRGETWGVSHHLFTKDGP